MINQGETYIIWGGCKYCFLAQGELRNALSMISSERDVHRWKHRTLIPTLDDLADADLCYERCLTVFRKHGQCWKAQMERDGYRSRLESNRVPSRSLPT